jgi:hypothetical protein
MFGTTASHKKAPLIPILRSKGAVHMYEARRELVLSLHRALLLFNVLSLLLVLNEFSKQY